MKLFIALIVLGIITVGIMRGSFVKEDVAVRSLEIQGYSNIQITSKDWLAPSLRGCGRGDAVRFVAEATNPVGKMVEVYVCAGWPFKGATIRTK